MRVLLILTALLAVSAVCHAMRKPNAEEAMEAQGRMVCTTDDGLDGVCRRSGNCPPARLRLTSTETVCPGGQRRPKICCPFRQQDAEVAIEPRRRGRDCTTDDGLDGVCRRSGNCPPARLRLTSKETVCPGGRRRPKICCPSRQQSGNHNGPDPATGGSEVSTDSPVVSTGGGFNTGEGSTGGLSTGGRPVGSQQGGRFNKESWPPWESTAAPGGGGGFSFNLGSTLPETPSRGSFGAESSGGSSSTEPSGLGSSGTNHVGSPSSGGFVDEPSSTSPTASTSSGGGFASSGPPGGGFASGGTSGGGSSTSGSSGGRFSGGGFASSRPSGGGSSTSGSSGGRFSGGGFASSRPSGGGSSTSGSSGGRFSGGGFASSGSSDGDLSGGGSSGGGFSGGGSPDVDKGSSSGTSLSGGGGSTGGGFSSGGGFVSGSLPGGGGAVGSGSTGVGSSSGGEDHSSGDGFPSGEGSFGGGQNGNGNVFGRIDASVETTSVAPASSSAECGLPTPKVVWLQTGRAAQQPDTPTPVPNLFDIRVIGGKNAEIGKWPWIALIGHKQGSKPPFWICGGTLIDNQNILTAAHCLKPRASNPATLVVRLGEYDTSSADDGANPQDYGVTAFTNHRDFAFPVLHDDISLVHLDKPVVYTDAIKPICLPTGPSGDHNGTQIDVAGWGYTQYGGKSSSILQEVNLPVVAVPDCQAVYATAPSFKSQFPGGFGDNKLCAGGDKEGGKDACQGDSGGPMVSLKDGRYELMGVVSAGVGCGHPGFPGVYTRVSAYLDWIQQNKT